MNRNRNTREGIDWPSLEALVVDVTGDWYYKLEGRDAYEKLRDLRARHTKQIIICLRSKRRWDGELTTQAKVVRKARRGGVRKRLIGGRGRRDSDMWKAEATKMKALIKRKKEAYWQKFCEKSGKKNPWEVVMWARDPFCLGERMGILQDAGGTLLSFKQEKADGFVQDIFGEEEEGWKPE